MTRSLDRLLKRIGGQDLSTIQVWLVPAIAFGIVIAYACFTRLSRFSVSETHKQTTHFFRVTGPDLWGDYGDILIHGMTGHLERKNGMLQLERAGPYMPPVTFPSLYDMIITDEFRGKLEKSGLGAFGFRSVVKARIVDLEWQKWDLKAAEAPVHPKTGEPEDYILERPHSQKLADAMGDVWEVVLKDGATVDTDVERKPWDYDVRVHSESWSGQHLFWGVKYHPNGIHGRWIIATERGKKWLEENFAEWVRFEPLLVK